MIHGGTTPLSGVNVVAVDATTGAPAIARLSGPRTTPYHDQAAGEFRLIAPAARQLPAADHGATC